MNEDADDTPDSEPLETDDLAEVASRAVRAGGEYLAETFRSGPIEAEFGTDDVKAAADHAAEERVLTVVRDAYPEHAIRAEESGRHEGNDYEWIVDPLDGTNNFASGLPLFASAVAVCRAGEPVVSAIYEPLIDSLYLAVRGEGATVDGKALDATNDRPLDRGTVSLVLGLRAVRDDELRANARRVETALRGQCKRVLNTWSPCVDWGLVARGSIEGIVCLYPDVYEQAPGELLAAESGLRSHRAGETYVGAGNAGTLSELRRIVAGSRNDQG